MIVVDAGPLINLGALDRLSLLVELASPIYIPTTVWDEVVVAGAGLPGAEETRAIRDSVRVVNRSAELPARVSDLDAGEADAIAVALELGIGTVAIDDQRGRRAALALGLTPVGTLGILVRARRLDLVDSILPDFVRLRQVNRWIAESLLNAILADFGEPPL